MKINGVVVFIIFITFVVDLCAAIEFSEIAGLKGHSSKKYFWWCFLTATVGWLMVVALPDRAKNGERPSETVKDELPDL